MRRFISLIMAAVLLFNVPVYAASYASLNKTKTIRDGVQPSDQYLKITPLDEVSTGSSIIISFTNAKIVSQEQINAVYQYDHYNWKGEGFWEVMTKVKTNELPYRITRVGTREIQVKLINLPRRFADNSLYTVNGASGRPCYRIRLPFESDGEGTIKITINNNDSTISSATLSGYYVWTKGSGSADLSGLSNTEGDDGEIISEAVTETTTASAGSSLASVSEEETEETTELPNIFDLNYNDYIAVRDLGEIIENSLFDEETETTTDEEVTEEAFSEEQNEAVEEAAEAEKEAEAENPEAEEETVSEKQTPPAEADLDIIWDAHTKTAVITYNDIEVRFIAYSDYYVVNDEIIYFDGGLGSVIIDGKMYVPAGLVIETLKLTPPDKAEGEAGAEE